MNEDWPSVRLLAITLPVNDEDYEDQLPLHDGRDLIEFSGRWDYGENSIAKMGTDPGIIGRWLSTGEESMVEMVNAVFLITCSRVVSHELVRHRIASYQQESQRFVAYDKEAPANLTHVPEEIKAAGAEVWQAYQAALTSSLRTYKYLRDAGVKKQIARYVLPNATRTRVVTNMDLREWRHVLQLRLHTSAQPEMRQVMSLIHKKLGRIYGPDLIPPNLGEERTAR